MGGRGAYYSGRSNDYNTREYDAIDTVKGIKVLTQRDETKPMSLPTHANTSTSYIAADKNGKIRHIGIYENGNLVRSIDLDDKTIHAHDWETIDDPNGGHPITRRKVGAPDHLPLSEDEKKLVKKIVKEIQDGKHKKLKLPEGISNYEWYA